MKGGEVFPSKWLKADDLDGDTEVTIDSVTMETLKDPTTGKEEQKPVVWFKGEEKGVILNVTNWRTLEDVCGSDDSDDWSGHTVTLGASQVEAFGKLTNALRFRLKPQRKAGGKAFGGAKAKGMPHDEEDSPFPGD